RRADHFVLPAAFEEAAALEAIEALREVPHRLSVAVHAAAHQRVVRNGSEAPYRRAIGLREAVAWLAVAEAAEHARVVEARVIVGAHDRLRPCEVVQPLAAEVEMLDVGLHLLEERAGERTRVHEDGAGDAVGMARDV